MIKGKPTYFPEKILTGLIENGLIKRSEFLAFAMPHPIVKVKPGEDKTSVSVSITTANKFDLSRDYNAKIHTMREDNNDRWQVGTNIDFFINARQKSMFRFAPVLPVVSTQKVSVIYKHPSLFFAQAYPADIYVDGEIIPVHNVPEFARNDGFDNTDDFFAYFKENFIGKIIHWTDKRY